MLRYAFHKPSDLPDVLPVFPLTGAILFPKGNLPLNVFEPRYLNMIDDAMYSDRLVAMIQPAKNEKDYPSPRLLPVGCVGRITSYTETDDGRYLINLAGICRFNLLEEIKTEKPYRCVKADYDAFKQDMDPSPAIELASQRAELTLALRSFLSRNQTSTDWEAVKDAPMDVLVHSLAAGCPFNPDEKQALLEAETLDERCKTLISLLRFNADNQDGTIQ